MAKNEMKITIPVELPGLNEAIEKAREINMILMKLKAVLGNAANDHDGCEGCAYIECSDREEPCSKCRHNYTDKFRWKRE